MVHVMLAPTSAKPRPQAWWSFSNETTSVVLSVELWASARASPG